MFSGSRDQIASFLTHFTLRQSGWDVLEPQNIVELKPHFSIWIDVSHIFSNFSRISQFFSNAFNAFEL